MKRHVLKYCLSMLFCCLMAQISFSQARGEDKITFDFECKADLESVSFYNESSGYITIHHDYKPHAAFVAPHWTKGNPEFKPVGYVAGQKAQVSAIFNLADCDNQVVRARGVATIVVNKVSMDITFPEMLLTKIGKGKGEYTKGIADKAFTANMVDYFEKFQIKWQVQIGDKGAWQDAGTSENPMYVPLSQLKGCSLDDDRVFYSVIHYACEPAKGLSNDKDIFDKIWNVFVSKAIPRIDKPKYDKMTYWGANNPLNVGCRGMAGLLDYEDANCGEWSLFLRNCLGMHSTLTAIQGCEGSYALPQTIEPSLKTDLDFNYAITFEALPTVYRKVFLVKKWEQLDFDKFYFIGKKYINFLQIPMQLNTSNYIIGNSFTSPKGILITRGDKTGDLAQGMVDPETVFQDHVVVCMPNGKIYDPSYGTGPFLSNLDWEVQSVDGYAIETEFEDAMGKIHFLIMKYENETPLYQIPYSCH